MTDIDSRAKLIAGLTDTGEIIPLKVAPDGSLTTGGGSSGGITEAQVTSAIEDALTNGVSVTGTGDASASNQQQEIDLLENVQNALISSDYEVITYLLDVIGRKDATSIPSSDSEIASFIELFRRLLKRLTELIQIKSANTLPQSTDTAIIATLRDNVNTSKAVAITGSGTGLNTVVIPSTDVSDYSLISVQISGSFAAQFSIEGSNNEVSWFAQPITEINQTTTGVTFASALQRIFNITKQTKYVRVRIVAFTSGTVNAILYLSNVSGYNNPLAIPSPLLVKTELPGAIAIPDSINQTALMPYLASVGLSYGNGGVFIRNRSCSILSGEGQGRQKVTNATEVLILIASQGIPFTGATVNLGSFYSKFGAQLIIESGILTSILWRIEGSFNGLNWFELEISNSTINGSAIHSSNKLFLYIRTSIAQISGTNPVVSIRGGAIA